MTRRRWSPEEMTSLRAQVSAGTFVEDITIRGRSVNSIRNKATRLGLIGDGIIRRPWNQTEIAILKAYLSEGWTASDILKSAQIVLALQPLARFSRNAIQKQIQRLGLANKKKSRRARAVVQFTQDEKVKFREFLRENYGRMTPEQLAKVWNKKNTPKVKRTRVILHLTIIGCKLPWKTIMQMKYSKNKRRKRPKRKKLSA